MNRLKKKYDIIILCLSVLLALVLRFFCKEFESEDFLDFLNEWVAFYRENGGWSALKDFRGDYNVLYQYILISLSYVNINCLYLIKAISVLFDFLLALACAKILSVFNIGREKRNICFSVVVLLPTIFLNSSFWAQCDSIYTAFIVFGIYFLLRKKNRLSIAFLAVAFAFKLQTVFIMPIYLIAFLKKRIKFRELLIFPAVLLVICVPASICGKTLTEILNIYLTQTTEYPMMVMNAPTVFEIIGIRDYNALLEKVFIAVAGAFVLGVVILTKDKQDTVKTALVFSIGIPFFLPHMHERYFYLATVFAVICAFLYGRKYIPILILAELSSLICYMQYFDFVNIYSGAFLSFVCTNTVSAGFMLLALILSVLNMLFKLNFKSYNVAFTSAVLATVLITNLFSQNKIGVLIDKKTVSFPVVQPYYEGNDFLIPLKDFVNASGGTVSYDGKTQQLLIIYDNLSIVLKSNSDIALVNGTEVKMSRIFAPKGFSYLSCEDIAKLVGLNCKTDDKKIIFSS